MDMFDYIKKASVSLLAFFTPIILFIVVCFFNGFIPFGDKSPLVSDLYYQYIDFFSWFRNSLLDGSVLPSYSFSISLGDPTIPLIAYYLASPLNWIAPFFSQESMPCCILLLIGLKLGLSGFTMYLYGEQRFSSVPKVYILIVSLGYALMHYNIGQSSNIMWLDGVYMLPLILLGAYRVIKGKSGILLSVSICCSILFNWYTAYMNCLFVALYAIFELTLLSGDIKKGAKRFLLVCVYELIGVLLSCFLFIPVVYEMVQTKLGVETSGIFTPKIRGNILKVIRGLFLGNSVDDPQMPILFCGTAFVMLLTLFFVLPTIQKKIKYIVAAFLGIMLISVEVVGIENIWNGFRFASSYYCRFAYLFVFLIIYIGLWTINIITSEQAGQSYTKPLLLILVSLFGIFSAFDLLSPVGVKTYTAYVYFIILYALWARFYRRRFGCLFLLAALSGELLFNAIMVFPVGNSSHAQYVDYVVQQKEQVELLRKHDDFKASGNFYRLEETMNRQMSSNGISAAYNDSMAYGYYGLANYTSTTNSGLVHFASSLGYYDEDAFIIPYAEPILSSDSLLGIRYVMSHRALAGYQLVPELSQNLNGKNIYKNSFALPLGIFSSEQILENVSSNNPFAFQNEIYSKLLGRKCEIFKIAEYTKEKEDSSILIKTAPTENPQDIIYAAAETSSEDLPTYIDDEYRTNYHKWLSYRTMCLGSGEKEHILRFDRVEENPEEFQEQVYYLDMQLFQQIINELNASGFNPEIVENGYIADEYIAERNGYLLLTVPYDTGWHVTVNSMPVDVMRGMNTFIAVPVQAGTNEIICQYKVPGLQLGVIMTVIGLFSLVIAEKKRR